MDDRKYIIFRLRRLDDGCCLKEVHIRRIDESSKEDKSFVECKIEAMRELTEEFTMDVRKHTITHDQQIW